VRRKRQEITKLSRKTFNGNRAGFSIFTLTGLPIPAHSKKTILGQMRKKFLARYPINCTATRHEGKKKERGGL